MTRPRTRPLAATALLLALVVGVLASAPAAAQTGLPPQPGAAALTVEQLTGVLLPGGELRVRVRLVNESSQPLSGLRVVGTLHRRTYSRFDYQQAVDEGAVGEVWSSFGDDAAPLDPGGSQTLDLTSSAAALGFARPEDKYGVYPLRLQLLVDGTSVDELVTSVVLTPEDVDAPVRLAAVWPLDARPAQLADGSFHPRLLEELDSGGRLTALVEALDADAAVTLAPSGLLLDQLADMADGFTLADGRVVAPDDREAEAAAALLDRLREAAARPGTTQITPSYGPGDLVALVRGGLSSEAAQDIGVGRAAIAAHTGSPPAEGALLPPDGLDAPTLEVAVGTGVDTVVLTEEQLSLPDDRDLQWSPSPLRRLRWQGGTPLTAVVPDPWLNEALTAVGAAGAAVDGDAVAAQRVLAETAAVYFERPNAADPRGLVLAAPRDWEPPRDVPAALLDGIARAPWLEPVTVPDLVTAVPAAEDPVALSYPERARDAELPADYVGELRQALVDFSSLASTLPDDASALGRFGALLRQAASVHYRDPRLSAEGAAKVAAVSGTVDDLYGAVTVADSPPVVLTSTEGQVPVTLTSSASVPLRVRVRLATNRYTFDRGDAQEVVLEPGEVRTLTFAARALTAGGTHSIRVFVEDPAGGAVLAQGTVVVRSTAYSRVALVVTGAAAAFLLLWWLRDLTRRRGRGPGRRQPARAPAATASERA